MKCWRNGERPLVHKRTKGNGVRMTTNSKETDLLKEPWKVYGRISNERMIDMTNKNACVQ